MFFSGHIKLLNNHLLYGRLSGNFTLIHTIPEENEHLSELMT